MLILEPNMMSEVNGKDRYLSDKSEIYSDSSSKKNNENNSLNGKKKHRGTFTKAEELFDRMSIKRDDLVRYD